jgi:hypothetical protein
MPANPTVNALVNAIDAGHKGCLQRERVLDDCTVNGRMTVDREERSGLRLLAGEMSTAWRFELAGDKISRIETGQAG